MQPATFHLDEFERSMMAGMSALTVVEAALGVADVNILHLHRLYSLCARVCERNIRLL